MKKSDPVLFTIKNLHLRIDSDRVSALSVLVLIDFEEILRREYFLRNTQNIQQKAKL